MAKKKTATKETGTPPGGQIIFIENHLAFKDGQYTIKANLTITAGTEQDSFSASKRFAVTGDRFSIPSSLVDNVFPLAQSDGEYSNVLPHLVLTRKTLPWERQIQQEGPDKVPWMTLLLLDHNETGFIDAVSGTVENLYTNSQCFPPNTISYPLQDELKYGHQKTDPCQYLDLPIDLFNDICPSKDELIWLAHARQVYAVKKVSDDETLVNDYATVMCNRLPLSGSQNTIHLVSLENLAPYLPSSEGKQSDQVPAGTTTIRLISLYNWSFTAWEGKESFTEYLKAMVLPGKAPFNLRMPDLATVPATDSQKYLQNALRMGFIPMNHHTRRGDHTVSWYRGPLLPFETKKVVNPPYLSSDEATRYDPENGLFDVSYAMAWEIGRLSGLADKKFSVALYNWKKSLTQQQAIQAEEEILREKIEKITPGSANGDTNKNIKTVLLLATKALNDL